MYLSELLAIGSLLPPAGLGLEVGVGSGRFAWPLGIGVAVEPSVKMTQVSTRLGIRVCRAVAEGLPFVSDVFDFALMVTTVCFVDEPDESVREIYRVLKPAGAVVVGFVERDSELGERYRSTRHTSGFYKEATFFTADEVLRCLRDAGFDGLEVRQTIFTDEGDKIQPVREGHGEGSFVAIKAIKM